MRFGVWLVAAMLSTAIASEGQSAPGILQGKVMDQAGAPIPQASVVITDVGGRRFELVTDPSGRFSLQDAPGIYDTTVSAQAFRTIHSSMTYSTEATAVITLQVGTESGVRVQQEQAPSPSSAPSADGQVRRVSTHDSWEYGALFQGGLGLTQNRSDFKFLLAGAHVGKILTPEMGTGRLRGNFEYAAEIFPYWQSFTPKFQRANCYAQPTPGTTQTSPGVYCSSLFTSGGTYSGVSITPIILRWNLTHGTRVVPWVQGAGGLLWTNHKYPGFGSNQLTLANDGPGTEASVWNFTPQGGVGAHVFVKPCRSVDFSANAVHISSASLGDKNPGVNASVQFAVGYTWWK